MNIATRLLLLDDEDSVFKFTIDTRNIVAGATNGSENPLTFKLPISGTASLNFTLRVSDGRPDVTVSGVAGITNYGIITFANPGIYQISLIGYVPNFSFYFAALNWDSLKMISIDNWGNVAFVRAFIYCPNLIVNAKNTLVLPADSQSLFSGIKEYRSDLSLLDTTKCTNASGILQGVQTPLTSTLNPFWKSLIVFGSIYSITSFNPSVTKIEVISDTITSLNSPLNNTSFTGEFIFQTPNLNTLFRVIYGTGLKPHLGKVDVRNVTTTTEWIQYAMTQANTDATILGWANLPFMKSGVTWDWKNSKYSNNPSVIAALNKITVQWGAIFTNLTMA